MKKSILVIDDDDKMNNLLKDYLAKFNYNTITSVEPGEGIELLKSKQPDLVILDVMLPNKNGIEVCKEIRQISNVPIVMLTARGDVTDRIVGLELGADDYLPKPFEPRELAARIQSIFRRTNELNSTQSLKFENLTIDSEKHLAMVDGNDAGLTTMEFELLELFAKNREKVLSRERLMEMLKGTDWETYDRSVDVLISRLRQKLNDDPKQPKYIKTMWGSGYKFIGGSGAF
jgi:two-component system phosphate regulon response regulator OmpR